MFSIVYWEKNYIYKYVQIYALGSYLWNIYGKNIAIQFKNEEKLLVYLLRRERT